MSETFIFFVAGMVLGGVVGVMAHGARYGAGAEMRRYLGRATQLGVPAGEQKDFCRGMWEAKRAVDARGYCDARREDGIAARHALGAFDRGFRRWLDEYAAGMPAAPADCVGVAKWEGCRLCRWLAGGTSRSRVGGGAACGDREAGKIAGGAETP